MSDPADVQESAAIVPRLRAAGCVFAEEEAALLVDAADGPERERMVAARVAGLPLEQVLGWAEFDGMRILVSPNVFVPRRRTELLVRCAVEGLLRGTDGARPVVVVDLCCGTGAVGAAIARRIAASTGGGMESPAVEVYAADLDAAAVACARRNLPAQRVFGGDLFDALPARLRGGIDVLAVNAPYVPSGAIATMPPEAREHEARMALDGGSDGLELQRRVVEGASEWLAPGGRLLIETSEDQAPRTGTLFAAAGFAGVVHRDDDLDGTVVSGVRATR